MLGRSGATSLCSRFREGAERRVQLASSSTDVIPPISDKSFFRYSVRRLRRLVKRAPSEISLRANYCVNRRLRPPRASEIIGRFTGALRPPKTAGVGRERTGAAVIGALEVGIPCIPDVMDAKAFTMLGLACADAAR